MDEQQRAMEFLPADSIGNAYEFMGEEKVVPLCVVVEAITAALRAAPEARPLDEWREDYGPAVWWSWDEGSIEWLGEPAWIGSPDDSDWPGYHTHWTPHPAMPVAARPLEVK